MGGVLALSDVSADLEAIEGPLFRPEDFVVVEDETGHVVEDAAGVAFFVFVLDGSEVVVGPFVYWLSRRKRLHQVRGEHLNWRSN